MPARLLFACFLLWSVSASADPNIFKLPPGYPAPGLVAQADAGLTINDEVLKSYGFTLAQYNAMGRDEQDRVVEWIKILETEKRKARARAAASVPLVVPKNPATEPGTEGSMLRMRRAAELPSSFDGAPAVSGGGVNLLPGFTPHVDVLGYGGVRRLTLTGPDGLSFEAGQLGLDGRSPLVAVSPYIGGSKVLSGSTRRFDYDFKLRAYAVNLGARLYTDDNPAIDARIDRGIDSLRGIDPTLGIKPGTVDKIQETFAFSHTFENQWLFYGSALGRIGRAYQLTPRIDVGWSAMGVMRVAGLFPNLTLDQTVGARINPGGGQHVGLFGGMTEGIGLVDRTMVTDSINAEKLKTRIHPEAAPHVHIAAWGKIPYLSNAEYTVSAGRQWNPWTNLTSVTAGVAAPVGKGVKVGVFGRYSDESGFGGDFSRRKGAAGVTVSPTPGLDFFGQYSQDSAKFGTAQIDNHSVLFGLTISETAGPAKGASITLASLFGGKDQLLSTDQQAAFAKQLQSMLDIMLILKGAALTPAGGIENGWSAVQKAWKNISAESRQIMIDAWAKVLPDQPALDKIMAISGADVGKLDSLVDLLSDTKVLERLMVRALRSQILKELESVEIPLLGKVRMSAPMVLAAANAYSLGLSPIPPATARDQETLNSYLLKELGERVKCPPGTAEATTTCVLDKLPPDIAEALKKTYGGDLADLLKGAVDWPSGVLRREINRMVLQVMLAAEALNELSVDQGEKIADLNVRGLMDSFGRLDARSRKVEIAVLKSAVVNLKAELDAQDADLRVRLAEYGSSRLAWLQNQPAWPSNVQIAISSEDWPQLLAIYGDAKLFDFILRCKTGLAAAHPSGPARLMIGLDRTALGSFSVRRGNPMMVSLPPRKTDLTIFDLKF